MSIANDNGASSNGRATWDDRGNSTWEWQTQPGIFTRDVDTQQIRALGDHLKLEEAPRSSVRFAR